MFNMHVNGRIKFTRIYQSPSYKCTKGEFEKHNVSKCYLGSFILSVCTNFCALHNSKRFFQLFNLQIFWMKQLVLMRVFEPSTTEKES